MASVPRCVLVDDDPDFVTFVRVCLRRLCPRLEVVTFPSGVEAIRYLARHHVDLLITDFKMPGLNGLELTREVRAVGHERDLPIVVMSGDEIESDALAHGANAFVPKRDLTTRLVTVLQRFGFLTSQSSHREDGARTQ